MVEVKFSTSYYAKRKRIQRLPKLVELSADTISKRDAVTLIDTFREGLANGSFGLEPLQATTVARKQREGKRKPRTPLYGAGEAVDTSYINVFKIRKLKKGYRVYARWAKHHESGIPLRDLLDIHEKGRLIQMPNGTVIRIPPRPAFRKAYNRFLRRRIKQENVAEVQDAMRQLIRTGKDTKFKKLTAKTKETDKYDEA